MEFPKKRSEFREWQNEMNAKVHQYLNGREADYPALKTQLGLIWHDINNGTLDKTGEFYQAIATAKAANPRPDWVTEYINYDFSKETFEEDLDAPVAEATMEEILDDVETTEE
tara:strand:- start:3491 stop:3829 length:339 start_codon:yes stop_codon:yes gene_type:complete